jgi:hypothetical protein
LVKADCSGPRGFGVKSTRYCRGVKFEAKKLVHLKKVRKDAKRGFFFFDQKNKKN